MPLLFPKADRPPGDRTQGVGGLRCAEPECDGELELRWSPKLGRHFYGCSHYPDCNGVLPANQDGSPRGSPRTRELQRWRRWAHESFDPIWKKGLLSRGAAYAWLTAALGQTSAQAHMERLDIDGCMRVMTAVREKGPGTDFWKGWRDEKRP